MRAGDVPGLPVVCIDSGEDIAEIRDVIYDGAEHRLLGFTLNKRGLLAGRSKDVLLIGNCVAGVGCVSLPPPEQAEIAMASIRTGIKRRIECRSNKEFLDRTMTATCTDIALQQ